MDFGTTLAALLFLPCIATTTTFSLPSLARTLDVVLPSNYTGNTSYQGQTFHNSKVESVLRTQRDLAYNTTIDRILWPAVSLSTAYFNKDFSTKKIGNVTSLLFMGYRRLVIDLYWDGSKGTWQLCPTTNVSFITTTTSSSPLSATATSDNSVITTTTSTPTTTPELVKRDIASSDQTIAGVVCPPDPHLRYLLSTLNTYMSSTSMNLNSDSSRYTDLLFLVLNLHDLHLSPSLSSPLYNLTSVNTNLTLTRLFPDPLVFSLRSALLSTFNSTNMLFTPANQNSTSTWPLWSTLVQNDLRVIVSFGVTDLSANTTYNVTADQDVVFPATAMNAGVGMANLTAPAWPDPNNCSVPVKGVVMVPGPNETAIELGAISNGEIEMSWNWAYMSDGGAAGFAFGVEQNLSHLTVFLP
ncbi:hypothetical protein BC936DRAFT_143868 [Jimgerdemannia flammicorona]|uniref:Maintenance of telomere capping protein 6 n=1 Tax=Jimgerdemannia flammicorona TaxID=994334 RepID=A0A432ZYE3_9FUNG|nr:hypothetical protein BC936DRAFT_143868 [Jimgerdemannia flammicorona]